jgi:hypothetical protein
MLLRHINPFLIQAAAPAILPLASTDALKIQRRYVKKLLWIKIPYFPPLLRMTAPNSNIRLCYHPNWKEMSDCSGLEWCLEFFIEMCRTVQRLPS